MIKEKVLKYINDSFGLEGDDALEIYAAYVQAVRDNVAQIKETLPLGNFDTLTRCAHSIKGCALNSGHLEMSEVAKVAESAGKAKDMAAYKEAFEQVDAIAATIED